MNVFSIYKTEIKILRRRSSDRICGSHHISNMYVITTELYLVGLMNFHWLEKYFISKEARFWVVHCMQTITWHQTAHEEHLPGNAQGALGVCEHQGALPKS
jgi:hypothetical protein